jgi:hypothetical protein
MRLALSSLGLALIVVALALTVLAAPAGADVFGTISLVSADPLEQADYAHDPAISGDGRFLVFDGSVGGVLGVWRKELASGALVQVAGGDAQLPSISESGQYVSFTTNEGAQLPAITDGLPDLNEHSGEAPNVYVRDMSREPQQEGAFQVVSAPSGSDQPLSYEVPAEGGSEAGEQYGALAAARSAINAEGSEVVFVTTAVSNLTRYPALEAEEREHSETPRPRTPALQVAVRDIPAQTTRLVSVRRDPATGAPAIDPETGLPEPVANEGTGVNVTGAVADSGFAPAFERHAVAYGLQQATGASISADGSTVAWMAEHLREQVSSLPGEPQGQRWTAPLWRRIGDGEAAPTRTVTGGADPENPACIASGEAQLPDPPAPGDPCQGPFETQRTDSVAKSNVDISSFPKGIDNVPQLSGDGYTVAFLANAPLVALATEDVEENTDLFLADMHPGLTRTQALRPLTELASSRESALATNAPVTDVAISPDASLAGARGQVAFTTARTVFILGSPTLVSTREAQPGLNELYDADLGDDTLTRVTQGYEGGPSEHPHGAVQANTEDPYIPAWSQDDGALMPSLSADGGELAFSSTASNLVFGDDNTPHRLTVNDVEDGSDAFLAGRLEFSAESPETSISPPPPNPVPAVRWSLALTAQSLSDGRVRLYLSLPGGGVLHVAASGSVPSRATAARKHKTARRASVKKTIASNGLNAQGGFRTVVLTVAKQYRSLTKRKSGVSATVSVTFTASGHPPLHGRVAVRFLVKTKRNAKGSGR